MTTEAVPGLVRPREPIHLAVRSSLLVLLLGLAGVRFVGSSVSAYLGVQGVDTRPMDVGLEVYTFVLVVLLSVVTVVLVREFAGPWRWGRLEVLVVALAAAAFAQWVGTAAPGLRIVAGGLGPWADFLLGATVVAFLACLTLLLETRLTRESTGPLARGGLRCLGYGFSAALGLRSIRLIDFTATLGLPLPSGVLWLLDFGPALLLAALAVAFWFRTPIHAASNPTQRGLMFAIPPLVAVAVLVAAAGELGGFILANLLAWGGSYTVFSPTVVSLPIIGFAVGAFLATAVTLRRDLPSPRWQPVVAGVALAALSGIQTSSGSLTSLVGIACGVATAATGLRRG